MGGKKPKKHYSKGERNRKRYLHNRNVSLRIDAAKKANKLKEENNGSPN